MSSTAAAAHTKPSANGRKPVSRGQSNSAKSAKCSSTKPAADLTALPSAKTQHEKKKQGWFSVFAQKTAQVAGRPSAFIAAVLVVVVWGATGPLFGYSDTWQLVINTGTTIVTFLMVFLIQNSQNRDSLAFQLKLDELIIAMKGAKNKMAGAEDLCDEDLAALHEAYRQRADEAKNELEDRQDGR